MHEKPLHGHSLIQWKYPALLTPSIRQRHSGALISSTATEGSQYVSQAYCNATFGMQRSYSHTGYPYDNACIEAFHSLIKREWLKRFQIQDYAHAYRLVFEYIETYYNTVRIHNHCD